MTQKGAVSEHGRELARAAELEASGIARFREIPGTFRLYLKPARWSEGKWRGVTNDEAAVLVRRELAELSPRTRWSAQRALTLTPKGIALRDGDEWPEPSFHGDHFE